YFRPERGSDGEPARDYRTESGQVCREVGAMMDYAYIRRDYEWDSSEEKMLETFQWVGQSSMAKVSPIEAMRSDGLFKNKFAMGDLQLRVVDTDTFDLIV